jgi:membrane-bound metal-dependent hydrolase YbcI (DUF457 family)
MNGLFHFFLSYAIIQLSWGYAREFIVLIFIASVIIDIDHIPYILKTKKKLMSEGFGEESRSFMHELPGVLIVTVLCLGLFLVYGVDVARVAAISSLLHYAADFAVGRTRPFWPFSDKVLVSPLGITDKKKRIFLEVTSTIIGGVVFWLLLG